MTLTANSADWPMRAFLVDCQKSGTPDADGIRRANLVLTDEPSFTISATIKHRVTCAWLAQGVVKRAQLPQDDPRGAARVLARLQGFPDSYGLPLNLRLACTIIGNAVCPPVAQAVTASLL